MAKYSYLFGSELQHVHHRTPSGDGCTTVSIELPAETAAIFLEIKERLLTIADLPTIFGAALLRLEFLQHHTKGQFNDHYLDFHSATDGSFRSILPNFYEIESSLSTKPIVISLFDEHKLRLRKLTEAVRSRSGKSITEDVIAKDAIRQFTLAYENQLAGFSAELRECASERLISRVPDPTQMIDKWSDLMVVHSDKVRELALGRLRDRLRELDAHPLTAADPALSVALRKEFKLAYPDVETGNETSPYEILSLAIDLMEPEESGQSECVPV
ncbi:hypothetical protein HNR46_004187 [Haloferula luteola]|uniref:Uncharacterized protein n=1 Tax=Haloferula luteola TaxID=595692 RepID=A0A840V7G8_9BACT|nr:hypothetical protein [Haloferula luteola]MBB5353922.1 hypothetical protein [Haloferula luteola]